MLLRPAPREVATASALYLEDAAVPRAVAAVRARAVEDGGELRVEVSVSPCGVGVEPLPGFAGRPGTNLRTAEELARLLAAGALRLVTRDRGESLPGELVACEWRPLPAREVDLAGHVRDGATPFAWPATVTFRSAPLPASGSGSSSWSYVEAEGVPRLAVEVRRESGGVRLAIASLAAPGNEPEVHR